MFIARNAIHDLKISVGRSTNVLIGIMQCGIAQSLKDTTVLRSLPNDIEGTSGTIPDVCVRIGFKQD